MVGNALFNLFFVIGLFYYFLRESFANVPFANLTLFFYKHWLRVILHILFLLFIHRLALVDARIKTFVRLLIIFMMCIALLLILFIIFALVDLLCLQLLRALAAFTNVDDLPVAILEAYYFWLFEMVLRNCIALHMNKSIIETVWKSLAGKELVYIDQFLSAVVPF